MLITEPCKKGQIFFKKNKSEQYFILLFSFQAGCITSADVVLAINLGSQMAFFWVQSPHLSLQLAHSTAKEHTWLSGKACKS